MGRVGMAFFKRVEVWVLLLLSGGVAVWVLSGDGNADLPPAWTVAEPSSNEPVLTLRGCTLERDYGNARLDLRVKVRNTTIRPLMLRPPMVKLLAGDEVEVALFFLPAEMPPDVAAGRTSEVVLRYWLQEAELKQPLVLVVNDDGDPMGFKVTTPLDLLLAEQVGLRQEGGDK